VVEVLARHAPSGGTVLDLACGLGANALDLASRGYVVHAWDYAESAIAALRRRGGGVHCEVRDVVERPPQAASFDAVLVVHFLERPLFPSLRAALRPGGILAVQTFLQGQPGGPRNPAFRLAPGELARLVAPLEVLHLEEREEGLVVARRR